jgi:WD40 repeat protein
MEAPQPIQNIVIKTIDIEGIKYHCKFHMADESLHVSFLLNDSLKYKGKITLDKIKEQISFLDCNLKEVLQLLNLIDLDKFSVIKENNSLKLKIIFVININLIKKEKNIIINLIKTQSTTNPPNDDIIDYYESIIKEKDNIISELNKNITELREIIKSKEETIRALENKLKNNKKEEEEESIISPYNNTLYNNFNIQSKSPINILTDQRTNIRSLTVLNDGRLVSGSDDNSIIIYNKLTYQPDIIIKEHKDSVRCVIKLSSGFLASCSFDKTIKIFNIKENEYELLQTLNDHTSYVYKIIELKNQDLVSCSSDKSIIFYLKDNFGYKKDYQISTNEKECYQIVQTKKNEICYYEYYYNDDNDTEDTAICFYDFNEKKNKSSIKDIKAYNLAMITKELLLIPGYNQISIINVNQYKLVRVVNIPDANVNGVCMLTNNMLLTGDSSNVIRQWRIEGNNLILMSKKENTHDGVVSVLLNKGDGYIVSGSLSGYKINSDIKIW